MEEEFWENLNWKRRIARILIAFGRFLVYPAGFMLLAFLHAYVWTSLGQASEAFVFEIILLLGAVVFGGVAYMLYGHIRVLGFPPFTDTPNPKMQFFVATVNTLRRTAFALVLLVVVIGLGVVSVDLERRNKNMWVRDYCAYGAQSWAQLDGCIAHVDYEDFSRENTPAARFIMDWDETKECGIGAGPFCESMRQQRLAEAYDYDYEPR